MNGLIFWDVDTQCDFMHADGRLYVPQAEAVIGNLARLTAHAHERGIRIVASADDHAPDHEELSETPDFVHTFPPHCLRGSSGQAKIPETALRDPLLIEPDPVDAGDIEKRVREHAGDILFHKHRFDVFSNPNVAPALEAIDPSEIVIYGVALDVCVHYAVEGLLAWRPQTRIAAVIDATKAIVADEGDALLRSWRERGVELILTTDALERSTTRTQERFT
jgi:nicotinamidase/pyrazinamidase